MIYGSTMQETERSAEQISVDEKVAPLRAVIDEADDEGELLDVSDLLSKLSAFPNLFENVGGTQVWGHLLEAISARRPA